MRLSQNDQHEFQHFLYKFRLLKLLIFEELLACGVFDFFEDLGAEDQLQGGVDDGVDIVCILFLAAVVEEYVDDFEAKKLEVKEVSISQGFFLLFSYHPVDEGYKIIKSVG